jgi:hypothetical protein
MPHLLSDDQNLNLADILKQEKKNLDGFHITAKQVLNEDKNQVQRDTIINKILQRLSD